MSDLGQSEDESQKTIPCSDIDDCFSYKDCEGCPANEYGGIALT